MHLIYTCETEGQCCLEDKVLPNAMIVSLCFCCCLVIMFSLLSCYYIFHFLIDYVFLHVSDHCINNNGTEWQGYRGRLHETWIAYSADKS